MPALNYISGVTVDAEVVVHIGTGPHLRQVVISEPADVYEAA